MIYKGIYEIDDVLFHEDIPKYNKFRATFVDPEIRNAALSIMNMCDEITVKHLELNAVDSMLRNKFFVVPESTKNYSVTEWEDTLRKRQNMDNWHLQKYRGVDTGYEFK